MQRKTGRTLTRLKCVTSEQFRQGRKGLIIQQKYELPRRIQMMSEIEKNTPACTGVNENQESFIDDSIAQSEQLSKNSNDLFGLPAGVMRRG